MLQQITLVCLLAASAYGAGLWKPDLRVRFGMNPLGIGTEQFIPMVQNMDQAIAQNWQRKERPSSPEGLESLELWCPQDDYSFCTLLDDTGYIAGVQIGVAKNRIDELVFAPEVTGFTSWTTDIKGTTVEYFTIHLYFISDEILKLSQEERLKNRDENLLFQHGYVWMTGINGQLYALSNNTKLLGTADSDFTTQACVPWMGQHYYYKMSKATTCNGEDIFPWFPLMDSDQLIGMGFMCPMKYKVDSAVKDYFEHPDESAVRMIVNNGPECLYSLASEGVLTMHLYFINSPFLVGCPIIG